ncbi:hypothetical protein CSUNSWCD_870 [Campylobacter showae CSUNSWCD]|uniref:Uncharacterized protein n=1 Tax=Campylobacter showae CSUNSWCD TaxID=1244083 RepID=M5INT5_9BACT|nr:hypothetical protein CSUNSWCD_870 [Campylobacter showae CSUNSWCD]
MQKDFGDISLCLSYGGMRSKAKHNIKHKLDSPLNLVKTRYNLQKDIK